MLQKDTQFDFSKQSRIEPNRKKWSEVIQPTLNFTKKHKMWFLVGISVFLAYQGISYLVSDSPQEIKTKQMSLQMAADNIPTMIDKIEKNKSYYDEQVNYLTVKEFDIKTNSMQTMQTHANQLADLNVKYKKFVNDKEQELQIIDKKIKETKSFNSLSSDEKKNLLEDYTVFKAEDRYGSSYLEVAINNATTTTYDDKVQNSTQQEELNKSRDEIKKDLAEIKKKSLKK